MNIAFCDDNKKWIETEKGYIDQLKDSSINYDVFYSGEELIAAYRSNGCIYDAIFLDMEMYDLDGINTANMIRHLDKHVMIVFVTSHTKYMKESFVCSPFRFLVKPIDFEEFKDVLLKIIENLEENKKTLVFTEGRNTVRLLYEEIIFIQSIDHCIYIKTMSKTYRTYSTTMTKLKRELSGNIFVQVHKSYIVNIGYIKEISKKELHLRNYNPVVPLSDTYKDEVKRKVMLFEERKHLS